MAAERHCKCNLRDSAYVLETVTRLRYGHPSRHWLLLRAVMSLCQRLMPRTWTDKT
ncbi:hypothetical protein XFF6992_450050 [Xanthomonas citri pv. fuscans]|nr:hypothetical protein XFF7767_410014 [Xanthomonas citri pv. fuscans]SOO15932.1 hypothetical protein XFF7766_70020 [Xanthomonas citri pv. fuscans]SOO20348.1 hypothetical protein XFF6992_450050 [Xanthomonas citri pv. fuscans]